jgi:hypothetical protein
VPDIGHEPDEGGDRRPAEELLDGDRLALLVVEEIQLRQPLQDRRAVAQREAGLAAATDDLLRRMP